MSSLPPGCTDSMCEPYDPSCEGCGCPSSNHYSEDKEMDIYETEPLNINKDFEYMAVELNADGEVTHACDSLLGKNRQCDCTEGIFF
jgi:hypothetical protein